MDEYFNGWFNRERQKQRESIVNENHFLTLSEFSSSVGLLEKHVIHHCKKCELLFIKDEAGGIWLPTCQVIDGTLNELMMSSIKRIASKFDAIDALDFITDKKSDGLVLHHFLVSDLSIQRCKTPEDLIKIGLELDRLSVRFHGSLVDAVSQNNEAAVEAFIQDVLTGGQRSVKTTTVDIDV